MRIGIDDSLEKYLTVAVPVVNDVAAPYQQLDAQSRVGIDPFLSSASGFKQLRDQLKKSTFKHELQAVTPNLVDATWEDRPALPNVCQIFFYCKLKNFFQRVKFSPCQWNFQVNRTRQRLNDLKLSSLKSKQTL